jgi:hypothetical protein
MTTSYAQDSIRIYGHVTDFNDQPIDSVTVWLKNKNFENLYETISDKNGFYSLTALKGAYYCLYAIRLSDYGKTKLEYWAWNIPAYKDLEINPQYERMEIYGINVFEPQVGPWDTYMIYFRPMSLTKSLAFQGSEDKKEKERKSMVQHDTINIAPNTINKEELDIRINERKGEVVNITRIPEYARGGYLYGYIVQVKKPEDVRENSGKYDKITIVLKSNETGEFGKGEYFIEK